MGRERRLTPREIGAIQALSVEIDGHSEIANRIGRLRKAVTKALMSLNHAKQSKKRGARNLSPKTVRSIVRLARTTGCTASALHTTYDLRFG